MYELVKGPLLWFAFAVFIGGSIFRLVRMFTLAKRDRVIYPYLSPKAALRSLIHWVVPFGGRNMRLRTAVTVVAFLFHVCLVVLPIFLLAHVLLWHDAWGIRWWTLSETLADVMTVIVISGGIFFFMRRLVAPEVRNVSSAGDFAILAIILAPYLTGFLAHHQLLAYKPMLTIHILSGEIMLIAIPLTRLNHMLYFFFTRSYMAGEFAFRSARDW
ncbi:MAG: TmcC family electron transfer complex membrane anchor subunit [Acidobacteriota bacterium]